MNAAAERGETALAEATRAQTLAARPDVSVWVSANAGSGKTRVLTNRVARLLLAGADPSRILCLTYTKAAAAEMQNRLFLMLGDWTMAEDEALRGALAALLSEGEAAPDGAALAAARRLFARALETPGGLRIQTIHAFCEGLLSRFPLEAGVSPQFEVIDEAAADALIADARDEAVTRAVEADPALAPALDLVMARLKEGGFDELIAAMRAKRGAYESAGGEDALARFLGAEPGRGVGALIDAWAAESDRAALRSMASAFAQSEKKSSAPAARALAIAADESASPAAAFEALAAALLKQDGAPKTHNFPAKDVTVSDPTLEPRLRALQEALSALREAILAAERFEASAAAARLAGAILSGYQQRKAERAALDYDDLIQSAVGLLTRSEARDWVRYKLDGGVEHILVDEAQDTSPGQWRAIEALSEEFFAGAGVERFGADEETPPQPRTLFAVGDEKQSIYSFQGAAPELLSRKGAAFAAQAEAAGARFERADMATSFRSTPAVLGFVDRVFASAEARRGLSFGPDAASGAPASVRHRAFRSAAPGQVDLWPLLEPAETGEEPPWDEPVDAPPPDDPKARLARLVAEEIVGWIDAEPLPAQGRAIRPGDVLILVRTREPYSSLLIKALKGLGAPVSG
ncbi:MAG: UvrD-helicase domain-containing protein, partial [Pseudomonadota bacterium]